MKKLGVWVVLRHEEHDVIELEVLDAKKWVHQTRHNDGFWFGPVFIPWHRIKGIEIVD